MYRFVPFLLILVLALGACGHKKTPAPAASSSSVTADALIYNSAHSDIAMDKWLACARFVQGTEMSGGMGALKSAADQIGWSLRNADIVLSPAAASICRTSADKYRLLWVIQQRIRDKAQYMGSKTGRRFLQYADIYKNQVMSGVSGAAVQAPELTKNARVAMQVVREQSAGYM